MDVRTGHLISEDHPEFKDLCAEYERVPQDMALSAQLELMGKDETMVGKEATGQVAEWARTKREKLELKLKRRRANKLCCR